MHYWRSYVHSQVVVFWYQIKASVHVTARTEICADPHTPILVLVPKPTSEKAGDGSCDFKLKAGILEEERLLWTHARCS